MVDYNDTKADQEPLKVVFLDRVSIRAELRAPRFPHVWFEYPTTPPEQVVERLAGADIAITNRVQFDASVLDQLPGLRLIAVSATGYDCIDVEACRTRGIAVINVRDWSTAAVAEHSFAMILSIRRQLVAYREAVRAGAWQRSRFYGILHDPLPQDLFGQTLSIIGYGAVGQRLEALGQGFGMRVLIAERKGAQPRAGRVSFDQALSQADVLCIACPRTNDTENLVDAAEIARLKPGVTVINTARGGIINEQALADALRAGKIGGAGIDTLSHEPPTNGNPLLDLDLPNVIVTPHVAFASRYTLDTLAEQLLLNIEAFVAGNSQHVL